LFERSFYDVLINPALRLGCPINVSTGAIGKIVAGSSAFKIGLKEGMIMREINGAPFTFKIFQQCMSENQQFDVKLFYSQVRFNF
jgi:hypothetical protein